MLQKNLICSTYLGRRKVEVAKLLGPNDNCVTAVGSWGHPLKLVLDLSTYHVKVI